MPGKIKTHPHRLLWLLCVVILLSVSVMVLHTRKPFGSTQISSVDQTASPSISSQTHSLSQVARIDIEYGWSGQGPSFQSNVTLTPSPSGFTGTGLTKLPSFDHKEKRLYFIVPTQKMSQYHDFLTTAKSQAVVGKYKPYMHLFDNYPYVEMILTYNTGQKTIFSSLSQSPDFAPWKMLDNEVESVISTNTPMQAFNIILPYLGLDH